MKKFSFLFLLAAITILPASASAAIECPTGQHSESVQVTAGTPEVPAYNEIINHPAVTHTVHHLAVKAWGWSAHGWGWITTHPAYDEVIVDVPAYTETIPHAAVPAVPATFEDQCVADTTPEVPTCTETEHLEENVCVPNEETPTEPPTCTEAQHLEDNVCINNEVTPPVDETPSSPASSSSEVSGGGRSGGGHRHCDVVGTPTCENWIQGINTPLITADGGVAGSNGGTDWTDLLGQLSWIKGELLKILKGLQPDYKG